jgi:hypothetical protein
MSELLSSITGGGGEKRLIMPQYSGVASSLTIKDGISTEYNGASASFYTSLEVDNTDFGFDVATLQANSDQLEQTIVDTGTGSQGVITQIKSPNLDANAGVIIRVYIDDKDPLVFEREILATSSGYTLCVGDFKTWRNDLSGAATVGIGGYFDPGYGNTKYLIMLKPTSTISEGVIGIPFSDSMRVTVQGTGANLLGSTSNKAAVCWLTSLPSGVQV